MKKITLENIKSIKRLEFVLPETHGVYLLVGSNGTGKTTLLVCLDRIGNVLAFAHGFVTSPYNDQIDQYKGTVITYDVDDPSLHFSFHKGNKRWTSIPKTNSSELNKYGYSSTVFIQANSKRIDVTTEDIKRGVYENASDIVKNELNELFETTKFNNLKRLKNKRGRGKSPRFFYVIQDSKLFYSEKRFSTGELALLRLVETLSTVDDYSLIMIDEAEMALHPRVQQNLLGYLKKKASEKNLTVIISTHSTTMIRATDKNHILLLDEDLTKGNGYFEIITPCYPAKATGCVDYIQNVKDDAVIFVEDDMAKLVLSKMINKCTNTDKYSTVSIFIVPVGGYINTAKMAINTKNRLFADAKVFALLDDDVFTEAVFLDNTGEVKELCEKNKDIIYSLGVTPETWIVDSIELKNPVIVKSIKEIFSSDIHSILSSDEYVKCVGENKRKIAKTKLDKLVNYFVSVSGLSEDLVLDKLLDILINNSLSESKIKSLIMPVLSKIR